MPVKLLPTGLHRCALFFDAQTADTSEANQNQPLKIEKTLRFQTGSPPAKAKRFLFIQFLQHSALLHRRRLFRQPEAEFTAFTHGGGNLHAAAVLDHNAFHDV